MLIWFFGGVIALIFLTYQDVKNNCLVDDRRNWYMLGLTTGLFFFVGFIYSWYYYICLLLLLAIGLGIIKQFGLMGSADIKTILWSFYGFGLIDWRLVMLML